MSWLPEAWLMGVVESSDSKEVFASNAKLPVANCQVIMCPRLISVISIQSTYRTHQVHTGALQGIFYELPRLHKHQLPPMLVASCSLLRLLLNLKANCQTKF